METLDFLSSDFQAEVRNFRSALGRFATGVTVVTTRAPGGKLEGLTANSFSAVSLDPPLVLWSLRRQAPSLQAFINANCFAVNVLSKTQVQMSRHFSTPFLDKFEQQAFISGVDGCPMLFAESLAIFECRTEKMIEGGDHIIFLGRVVRAHHRDGEPLTFVAGGYGTHLPLSEPLHARG
ncbi:flavin reductase family protein [Bradyrhizobium sp. 187]|jgi:flavin reductase (DIM6/NTAB) family NADH-FMN oxidoreductase RutF|uniref:flavin reductase family protein n=1 Tax=Bradyrhizobium sp. 187 TaxID=2782655 RepID=UPI0020001F2D|nr:flavin reductase family protein [Bradyrhizobium sp. 187]UPJ71865.1 flavin reductase family protein [Bradyrhizobium sp. 187]